MASFIEELWNSVFTPGATPTLLVATNATFAALQLLLFLMLLGTHSIHFVVLSFLSAGLWYAINWFARELQAERMRLESSSSNTSTGRQQRDKSLDPDSETETESTSPVVSQRVAPTASIPFSSSSSLSPPSTTTTTTALRPDINSRSDEMLRKRRSHGDSSGYVSTDSEWEKISENEET